MSYLFEDQISMALLLVNGVNGVNGDDCLWMRWRGRQKNLGGKSAVRSGDPLNGNFGISKIPCDSKRIETGKEDASFPDLPDIKEFSFQRYRIVRCIGTIKCTKDTQNYAKILIFTVILSRLRLRDFCSHWLLFHFLC